MDVKNSLKQKIIKTVLNSIKDSDWSVLVYDRSCAIILKNLFTKSEFITYNIVMSQYIDEERDTADFPVIYFVKCLKNVSKIINSDYLNKKYTSFMVCTLVEPEDLNSEIKWVHVHVNFVGIEDRVFISSVQDLYSVGDVLNTYFYVEYTNKNLKSECEYLDTKFREKTRSGKLIVFDRCIDMYTPFLHFYTFQSMLEDINITDMTKIYEEYGSTKLWKDVRHVHLGDMSEILKSYLHNVTSSRKKLDGNVNTKDLMKMVMDAPETFKTNEMLKLFFNLVEKCYEKFDYLATFSEIEQTISSGIDKNRKKSWVSVDDMMKCLCNKNIDMDDKLRLMYLYIFSGNDFTDTKKTKLVKNGFRNENFDVSYENISQFKPLVYPYKYEYEVSRYEPTISVILREYLKNNKKVVDIFSLEREKKSEQSLRRSALISVKKDVKTENIYCIYIKGGVTYAEMACIYKLSDEMGIEFLIGSDKIIRPKEFINEVVGK